MAENRHSIEERVELSLLYDFYGALLKENQRRMFEASILDDYNLAEIAEDENITRQGVHDAIKRACKQLREYEQKLGLVEKMCIRDSNGWIQKAISTKRLTSFGLVSMLDYYTERCVTC